MAERMVEVEQTLKQLRAQEKIPASLRRAEIRVQLLRACAEIELALVPTRIGDLGLAWNARGIVAIHLPRGDAAQTLRSLRRQYPAAPVRAVAPAEYQRELQAYATGQVREFRAPLDWSAIKPFQRAVLETANRIPFGETRTYQWIAQQIGKPRAARAVGRALATNPIPIILPCHRVIGSDGGLHGYGGGLPLKRKLLELEGAAFSL